MRDSLAEVTHRLESPLRRLSGDPIPSWLFSFVFLRPVLLTSLQL